jgi:hypothetical protein
MSKAERDERGAERLALVGLAIEPNTFHRRCQVANNSALPLRARSSTGRQSC